jgi:hypothetical protein
MKIIKIAFLIITLLNFGGCFGKEVEEDLTVVTPMITVLSDENGEVEIEITIETEEADIYYSSFAPIKHLVLLSYYDDIPLIYLGF